MAASKLELADCRSDSPQSRALVRVFESDAEVLADYARDLQGIFQRISVAQNLLNEATQALSEKLREFHKKEFLLCDDNEFIGSVMNELACKVDQISSYNAVLLTQITEHTAYPSNRFVEKYVSEVEQMKSQFQDSDKTHIEAMKRMAKVSKKRSSETQLKESMDHLCAARRQFHVTSMNYCSMLNLLQTRKTTGLLEPLVGYVQSQLRHFKMGADICQPELDDYLGNLRTSLEEIHKGTSQTEQDNSVAIDRIDAESTRFYFPDPLPSMDFPELPVNKKETQISGYLFARSPGMFLNQWTQKYYFTQGGNLMQQGRDEVAGGLVMDLDGCMVELADVDDRRYVFQISSQDQKHSLILQAESNHSRSQWIVTLKNISKGLYLANDPARAAELLHAAAKPIEPTPRHSQSSHPQPTAGASSKRASQSTSSESSQEHSKSSGGGMFARFKNAASSLVAPLNLPDFEGSSSAEKKAAPARDDGKAKQDAAVSALEEVVNSTLRHPIMFDLPQDNPQGVQQSSTQQKSSSPQEGENTQAHENSQVSSDESSINLTYVVRFLGSRQVEEVHNGYAVISESIRSVMAARALQNIFSTKELELVITDYSLRLVDANSKSDQASFATSDIIMAANHPDNARLVGIIVRSSTPGSSDSIATCYVFESNSDGGEVCCSIATAQVLLKSLVEQNELQRQKELESDLEEQSKLLAQSDTVGAITKPVQSGDFEGEDLTMRDNE